MKKFIILICSLTILTFSSCKKELDINVEKTYVEEGAVGSELGFSGIILTLMPDGKADFLNGGDIRERGTYTIRGSKIILKIDSRKFKFDVVSDTELKYEKTRVLRLAK